MIPIEQYNVTYFFHLVTLTISSSANTIRGSSVHGGLVHTAKPCDQSGNQLPVADRTIVYVRERARFSAFCAICSLYLKRKAYYVGIELLIYDQTYSQRILITALRQLPVDAVTNWCT